MVALALGAVASPARAAPAKSAATEFMRFIFGAGDVNVEEVCVPNPDLWMLIGPKHDAGLAEVTQLKLDSKPDRVIWEATGSGICIFELRDGKADARFLLDQVYLRHRRALLQFVYQSLRHSTERLAEVTTHPQKVTFGDSRPASPGDLDVYADALVEMPVVRISAPADDQVSRSVTYLLPLGPRGLSLRLIKRERSWLVDTSQGVDVPLQIFHEESKERRVIYQER